MNMTNLAYAENETENCVITEDEFQMSEGMWIYLVEEMKKVYRFTRKETKWFRNCQTAKLIATIPFAAGCDEPERTAIAHLCIYLAEIRGFQRYYAHLPSDDCDLFKRLGFISTFEGGKQDIIEYGMSLLALTMIEGYHKSAQEDKSKGIYNPFISEKWNYKEIKLSLISKIDNFKTLHPNCYESNAADQWI
ncbi:MAG: hypothetical protein IK024_10115 [Treponema sp.]|nr:hypothetical protein [Treponema sp.]